MSKSVKQAIANSISYKDIDLGKCFLSLIQLMYYATLLLSEASKPTAGSWENDSASTTSHYSCNHDLKSFSSNCTEFWHNNAKQILRTVHQLCASNMLNIVSCHLFAVFGFWSDIQETFALLCFKKKWPSKKRKTAAKSHSFVTLCTCEQDLADKDVVAIKKSQKASPFSSVVTNTLLWKSDWTRKKTRVMKAKNCMQ